MTTTYAQGSGEARRLRRPSLLAQLMVGASWQLRASQVGVELQPGATLTLTQLQRTRLEPGWFWDSLHILALDNSLELKGVPRRFARRFARVLAHGAALVKTLLVERMLWDDKRYLANFDIERLLANAREEGLSVQVLGEIQRFQCAEQLLPTAVGEMVNRLCAWYAGERSDVVDRNNAFIAEELIRFRDFFAEVEVAPLTEEQARAAIVFEDRNLLIAAAGSGKSSVVVAKIGYALKRKLADPDAILALAFNKNSAQELRARCDRHLARRLSLPADITIRTFHGLGMEILGQVEGAKPPVAPWAAESRATEGRVIKEIVAELVRGDAAFATAWTDFVAVWGRPLDEELSWLAERAFTGTVPPGQPDVMAGRGAAANYDEKRRRGVLDGNGRIPTLAGHDVRSGQECAIANWLFLHSVEYEYERPDRAAERDPAHRVYQPDFFYPSLNCYHEHVALDARGSPPPELGSKYVDGIRWKRAQHLRLGRDYFETTSAQFADGTIFSNLRLELERRTVQLRRKTWDEIEAYLMQLELAPYFALLQTCIKHLKSNELTVDDARRRAAGQSGPRAGAFLQVLGSVYRAYEDRLRCEGLIDFEDMIRQATGYVRDGVYRSRYKLILVDEFQDIGWGRTQLVRALLGQVPEAKLFCVGDDWQSIYRFAGADIRCMSDFAHIFGATATNYLGRTFRSNDGIATAAATFIRKNESQLPKTVTSNDKAFARVLRIVPYVLDAEQQEIVEALLEELATSARDNPVSVLLLARYNHQKPNVLAQWQTQFQGALNLSFQTVHRAKGLQADCVVILMLQDTGYAFPTLANDDPLLRLVMPVPEEFPHAEERRVFYVALTRARHVVYLVTSAVNPSPFVEELVASCDEATLVGRDELRELHKMVCPLCRTGVLKARKGPYSDFLGCSRYPDCRYIRGSRN